MQTALGIDPVHFGVVMVLNLMIGLLTPPVDMVLYVLSRISGLPFERCVAAIGPFLISCWWCSRRSPSSRRSRSGRRRWPTADTDRGTG